MRNSIEKSPRSGLGSTLLEQISMPSLVYYAMMLFILRQTGGTTGTRTLVLDYTQPFPGL
jgi:hypothetical protein